ncbi:uncharacterized protein F4807DRAFT_458132 [Annulohypoxylon truncatum]|uniref:uncharacterized protein n=1 Tax=Annulohypoxylon truncatum TaxID=327061 RepID=UPI002008C084|nr:uncharacterized protein F4807DRAFT_458132 [Annulohypoxylon truncatum]KAI1211927.1 hypothetical protein F4807DRAFT_458132 [Annulohypoxylon truncatum]
MSSVTIRSERLDSSAEPGEQSSRENVLFSSLWSQIKDFDNALANPPDYSIFIEIVEALIQHHIPSIEFDKLGVDPVKKTQPLHGIFSLGSGLTSDVIRHVTTYETNHIVPQGSTIALKTFRPHGYDNASGSKAARSYRCEVYQAILREIRSFCHPALRGHPNIIQLLFIGWQEESRFPIMAMELGEHGSLDFIIREANPGPTPIQKRHITLDIALGLRAIHRAGLVHGDLKPDNVLIKAHNDPCRQLTAKLIDFGGSSPGEPVHFTPLWSAPEVVNKDHDIDWEKADVFSFGLTVASLWARLDGEANMEPSSSCILSWYTNIYPGGLLTESTLFGIKSSPNGCIQLFNGIMENFNTGTGALDRSELLDILTPTLHPYFWQRPKIEDLVQLLVSFGDRIGRDIRQEDNVTGNRSTQECPTDRKSFGSGMNIAMKHQVALIREFIFEQHSTVLKNAGSSLVGNITNENLDIPEHGLNDLSHDQFIECLHDATERIFTSAALGSNTKTADLVKNAQLQNLAWFLAHVHSIEGRWRDLEEASEWMRISALCGYKRAIHFAALMDRGTTNRIPVRLYLSLLALSHSNSALQRLSTDWPDHFRIIREIIQARHLNNEILKEGSEHTFPLHIFTTHRVTRPVEEPEITTRQALEAGFITEIEKILDGNIVTPDLDEILPSFLHELPHLVDNEARPLARVSFERGAMLNSLLPCKSPILGCEPLERICVPSPASYSSLSSAIIHGKEMLAMAIFCLHVEAETPIPDFSTVLSLSFRYLQHDMGEVLLALLRENPTMCFDGANPWEINESSLQELLIVTMSRDGPTEYERRAIHGSKFDSNYEKCLQILLEEGADPTQGVGHGCPFFNTLKWDDFIGLKLFLHHLQQNGSHSAILDCIRDPGHTWVGRKVLPRALAMCIECNSPQCLELLIGSFPHLAFEELEPGYTLLHHACLMQPNTDLIRVLLDSGIEVTTSRLRGDYFTPLFEALRKSHLTVADFIASQCPNDLAKLVINGHIDHMDGFRWLAKHNGIHFYGPNDIPIWAYLFGRPRPPSLLDQIREAELLNFLLDLDIFRVRINEPSIQGMKVIQIAATYGHIEAVKVLLSRGADANARSATQGMSALDFAYLYFGTSCPEGIKAAGSLEMQKWRKDINSTICLLRKYADSSPAANYRRAIETMGSFAREHLVPHKFSSAALFKRRHFHGDWPQPISSSGGGSSMQRPLDTEPSFHNMIGGLLDDLLMNLSGNDLGETQKQPFPEFDEVLKDAFSKDDYISTKADMESFLLKRNDLNRNEADRQDAAFRVREMWRLPPNWTLLRIRGLLEVIYFIDKTNMRIVHEKPPLYCGGEDETSTYDRKGKGKDISIVHHDPGRQYLELSISPRTTSDSVGAESNMSCCFVNIQPNLDRSNHYDDEVTTIVGSFMGEILHATIVSDDSENLAALMDAIDDVEQTDWEGLTPLQQAVIHGKYDMANILVAHGGQVDRMYPEDGLLPLHVSIGDRSPSILELLLEADADPNGKTRDGIPPLHFCLSHHDKPEMVRALIRKGADVHMVAQNTTPLEVASSNGRERSLDVLREAIEDAGIRTSGSSTTSVDSESRRSEESPGAQSSQ